MGTRTLLYGKIFVPEQLGALIRQVCKEQGITQQHLSALAGVGSRLIGEIERGKQRAVIGKIFQLLAILGLDLVVQHRTTRDWRK